MVASIYTNKQSMIVHKNAIEQQSTLITKRKSIKVLCNAVHPSSTFSYGIKTLIWLYAGYKFWYPAHLTPTKLSCYFLGSINTILEKYFALKRIIY